MQPQKNPQPATTGSAGYFSALETKFTTGATEIHQRLLDEENEREIDRLYQLLIIARTPLSGRSIWQEYSRAINGRSPQQVERLERARGLR